MTIRDELARNPDVEPDQVEMRGIARSVTEVEWLLLAIVAIYIVVPGAGVEDPTMAIGAWAAFACLSLLVRFVPALKRQTRRKLIFQTVTMVVFTTLFIASVEDGRAQLPSLYLLPVIVSALTLGRRTTIMVIALATLGHLTSILVPMSAGSLTVRAMAELGVHLIPFLLVATVTTMLSHEVDVAKARIRALSDTDELTGLLNVRAFNRILKREHDHAVRYQRGYAVVMIDLNRLKFINDTYGHQAGNEAIREVAATIARQIRATDAGARYGGDEFIVLLSETHGPMAHTVAERIGTSIRRLSIHVAGVTIPLSASVGTATFPEDGTGMDEIVSKADAAMYVHKRSDRSRLGDGRKPEPGR